ncbi:MAG: hypothetical protein NTAFB09_11030 [Nitrosospira sp.]
MGSRIPPSDMIIAGASGILSQDGKRALASSPVLCLLSTGIGMAAWMDQEQLFPLALLLLLPMLIFHAPNRAGAFLVAFAYYGTATRAVPGIICYFFPNLSMGASLFLWGAHTALLALPWVIAFPPHRATAWRRAFSVAMALLILTFPPIGLFHWGTPLMASGLLYPGWQWIGLLFTAGLLALIAASGRRTYGIHAAIAGAAILAVVANVGYLESRPPADWRAVSLQLGKSPELWSDEMAWRREFLADRAMRDLSHGAKVIIFPESISGSNRRAQSAMWHRVSAAARAQGATVLVGEETWDNARTGFKNALVGYGAEKDGGAVVVSSMVPMPIGDWKFGFEEGAETNIFGSDIIDLHGKKVAFSLCYEDFLLWPHRGLLAGRADLLISATNQWPSSGTSAEIAQDISRAALARMAGVALLTAKNR